MPLVKLNTETYSPPDFPAKLRWHRFAGPNNDLGGSGACLAALELIEVSDSRTCIYDFFDSPFSFLWLFAFFLWPTRVFGLGGGSWNARNGRVTALCVRGLLGWETGGESLISISIHSDFNLSTPIFGQ